MSMAKALARSRRRSVTRLVVLAGEGVFATEEGTADAATNGVAYRDVGA